MAQRVVSIEVQANVDSPVRAAQALEQAYAKAAREINRQVAGVDKLRDLERAAVQSATGAEQLQTRLRAAADSLVQVGIAENRLREVAGLRKMQADTVSVSQKLADARAKLFDLAQVDPSGSTEKLTRAQTGALEKLTSLVQRLEGEYRDLAGQVEAIRPVGEGEEAALRQQVAGVGALRGQYRSLERQLSDVRATLDADTASANRLRAALAQVKLPELQTRAAALRAEADRAQSALAVQESARVLGVRLDSDIEQEIGRLRAAFERLKASGTASAADIDAAFRNTEARVAALTRQTNAYAAAQQTVAAQAARVLNGVAEAARAAQAQQAKAAQQTLQQDNRTLGVRLDSDIEREIADLRAAFGRLRDSGTASAADIAAAQRNVETRVSALARQTNAYAAAQQSAGSQIVRVFNGVAEAARAAQAEQAKAAQQVLQQGNRSLGLRLDSDVEREIADLRVAFERLKTSGVASAADIAAAQRNLEVRVAALTRQTNAYAAAQQSAGAQITRVFQGIGEAARAALSRERTEQASATAAVERHLVSLRQRNALQRATTELQRVEAGVAAGLYATYSAGQLARLRQLAQEYDANQALLRVERERAAQAAARASAPGNFAQGALSAGGFGFGGNALGAGIAAGLTTVFSVQSALDLERSQSALLAVTGSLGEAQEAMEFVVRTSERLGIAVADTARLFAQFEAASKGTALEGRVARDVFQAIAETGAKLNLRSFEMEGALRAVGQMMSKGTVQAEELRGQLGDRLPGAFNIMARALGVTTAELGEMLKEGRVLSDEALPKFAAELRKTFGTDVNTRIETTTSNFQRLVNEVKLLASVAGNELNKALSPAAEGVAGVLNELRTGPTGRELDAARSQTIGDESVYNAALRLRRERESFQRLVDSQQDLQRPDFLRGGATFDTDRLLGQPRPTGAFNGGPPLADAGNRVDAERVDRLKEELALLGVKTELERVEYEIKSGSLRDATAYEQSLARQLAAGKDALALTSAREKAEKKITDSAAESNRIFNANLADEDRRLRAQADAKRRLDQALLEAQGDESAAALAGLRAQYEQFLEELKDSADGLNLAERWFDAAKAKLAADTALNAVNDRLRNAGEAFELSRDTITARQDTGDIGDTEARNALIRARDEYRAVIDDIANSVTSQPGLFSAEQTATILSNIARIKVSLGEIRTPLEEMAVALRNAFEDSLGSALERLVLGTESLKQAFKSMAVDILRQLLRIAVAKAAAGIAGSLFSGFGGGGGAGAGAGTGGGSLNFTGFAQGGPVDRREVQRFSRGGAVRSAETLLKLAGGGMAMPRRFDDGGKVFGPGTKTSDSIPAMLSDGEFVIRAAAVDRFGPAFFEKLNRGFLPPTTAPSVVKLAQGGLVGRGGTTLTSGKTEVNVYNNADGTAARAETRENNDGGFSIDVFIERVEAKLAENIQRGRGIAGALQSQYGLNRAFGAQR